MLHFHQVLGRVQPLSLNYSVPLEPCYKINSIVFEAQEACVASKELKQ